MGGARHGEGEVRFTLESEKHSQCSGVQWWRLRSNYGKSWALRWFEAIKGHSNARKILLRFAFVSSLVFLFLTSTAYAVEGFNSVIYGPVSYTWQNVTYSQMGVIASNKYNAAAVALGYNPENFSSEVKAKLSNSSTGGSFYTFAQEFVNPDPDGFSVTAQGVAPGFWATCYGLYGEGNVWYAEVTNSSMTSAKEDLQAILNGGNLGGGGGGSAGNVGDGQITYSGDKVYFTFNLHYCTSGSSRYITMNSVKYYYSTAKTPLIGTPFTVSIPSSVYDTIKAGHDDMLVMLQPNTGSVLDLQFYYPGDGTSLSWEQVTESGASQNDGGKYLVMRKTGSKKISIHYYSIQVRTVGEYNNSSPLFSNDSAAIPTLYDWTATNSNAIYYGRLFIGCIGVNDSVSVPETNWPETPSVPAPTAPEVPEPDSPTTQPQPDPPTPQTNPTFPVYVDVSTTTYTVDLQGVLDAMNDHCIHLQNALHTEFSDFWTVLSTKMTNDFATLRQFLHGQFGWLGETIQDEMSETRDYLKELFEWLADQFDFTISGGSYNDSTVVSWLKRIYSKLGTGTSSKPVDPVADPEQTGSWLDTLINNLLTALNDIFPGLLNQVGEFFSGAAGNLKNKFPFSIPWDVAAVLGMLVAEPVAPSVEIPAYTLTSEGLTQVGTYDIDLSDYDAAWGAVRIMMRIAFALYVCVHTKDFLDVIERVMM